MLTYEQWDLIADSYVPALALLTLVLLIREGWINGLSKAAQSFLRVLLSVFYVYAVMFTDEYFKIASSLGFDYSTHTALALVLVIYLTLYHAKPKRDNELKQDTDLKQGAKLNGINSGALIIGSMFLYGWLMIYQGYHSITDITLTALIIIPVVCLVMRCKIPEFTKNNRIGFYK